MIRSNSSKINPVQNSNMVFQLQRVCLSHELANDRSQSFIEEGLIVWVLVHRCGKQVLALFLVHRIVCTWSHELPSRTTYHEPPFNYRANIAARLVACA